MDYSLIAQRAEEIALEAHVQLVETLAERIADWFSVHKVLRLFIGSSSIRTKMLFKPKYIRKKFPIFWG